MAQSILSWIGRQDAYQNQNAWQDMAKVPTELDHTGDHIY